MKTNNRKDSARREPKVRWSAVVRWLARLVDEQPDWFKALMAVAISYCAIRGGIDACAMLVWLSIRLAI